MTEYPARLARLTSAVADAGVDGLCVTSLTNVRYLCGYTGSNGAVVVGPRGARLLTDFRYATAVESLKAHIEVEIVARDLTGVLAARLPELTGAERIGFESLTLPYASFETLRAGLSGAELVPTKGVVESLRRSKSATEVEAIRAAGEPVGAAYERLCEIGLVGRTERELVWAILETFERAGLGPSFSPIVATGANGAQPHAVPGETRVADGDLVVVDMGARLDGYCSDCTRTLGAGRVADGAKADHALVLHAHETALPTLRPGTDVRAADGAARAVLSEAGVGELFGHGLGHGIGLDVHEQPFMSQHAEGHLAAGDVVSNEPGIYRPGERGVRIEDLVHVTADGPVIVSPSFPKTLVEA